MKHPGFLFLAILFATTPLLAAAPGDVRVTLPPSIKGSDDRQSQIRGSWKLKTHLRAKVQQKVQGGDGINLDQNGKASRIQGGKKTAGTWTLSSDGKKLTTVLAGVRTIWTVKTLAAKSLVLEQGTEVLTLIK